MLPWEPFDFTYIHIIIYIYVTQFWENHILVTHNKRLSQYLVFGHYTQEGH